MIIIIIIIILIIIIIVFLFFFLKLIIVIIVSIIIVIIIIIIITLCTIIVCISRQARTCRRQPKVHLKHPSWSIWDCCFCLPKLVFKAAFLSYLGLLLRDHRYGR